MSHLIPPKSMMPRLYTPQEVADLLGCSTNAIGYLIRKGQLPEPTVKTNTLVRFSADQVDAYLRGSK